MYKHLVLGGTFDGLHKGHQYFLTRAFAGVKNVTIGLTSEAYIKRFKKDIPVSAYSRRYKALTTWLRNKHLAERTVIIPLDNKWGPAVMGDFDAMAVTSDNITIAHEINVIRKERGLPPLQFVEITLVNAADGKPISSTRVRSGDIDVDGRMVMPDSVRPVLQKPLGIVLTGPDIRPALEKSRKHVVVTVGDITTQVFLHFGRVPNLAVIDLQVQRQPFQTLEKFGFPKNADVVKVKSGPGFISESAVKAIHTWGETAGPETSTVLLVDGEEDLLTLPSILNAPLGSLVYYGHPPSTGQEGLVEVAVTQEKQDEIRSLLSQFS
jgi:cytidyltransferase-like protein